MGVVLYELCNLQHAFQGEVRLLLQIRVTNPGWVHEQIEFHSTQLIAVIVKMETTDPKPLYILFSYTVVISKQNLLPETVNWSS